MTNATTVDAKGAVHFLSGFLYADLILNNQSRPGSAIALNVLLEYENTSTPRLTRLTRRAIPRLWAARRTRTYSTSASDKTRTKTNVIFGYAFERQEQDSILSSFAESDQRAPTNILQHRIYAQWRLRQNVSANYSYWIGRTLRATWKLGYWRRERFRNRGAISAPHAVDLFIPSKSGRLYEIRTSAGNPGPPCG